MFLSSGIKTSFAGSLFELPLVFDVWTSVTLASPNQPPYTASFGTLDGLGTASAAFTIPAGSPASLAGVTIYHCCLVFDGTPSVAHIALVSNPVSVTLGL